MGTYQGGIYIGPSVAEMAELKIREIDQQIVALQEKRQRAVARLKKFSAPVEPRRVSNPTVPQHPTHEAS
jgi:hypothetical protein